ncbi:pyridoxal phosphate-dependent aminotransferase [Paenalcaligenes niemegkensis]|uniref:pyridoxal phosphate-dependent aminotransferase n=1 Tax=Paenalcaligenes niemegkensis TaxID=2895469 RepID=UPI001EE84521|nr:pyridoxal phosphate-dependent aminotransferase [Paenalcaligenes niemegkensis]MCQ9618053.1 pyridoxal phosphate-dependent aminotransferase [Paenalcaligenes niemegkensis]
MQRIRPSPTSSIAQKTRALCQAGRRIISLGVGELDFDTPDVIRQAAIKAIERGETRYTDTGGTPALKQAIINKFSHDNGLCYTPQQVLAASGAKQIIFNAFLATLDEGDEVIIPAPYWVSYPDMVTLTGATPVIVKPGSQDALKLTPETLRQVLSNSTRWLILNSPGNPSGALYSADELRSLAAVLEDYPRVLVLSDDIYEEIVYEESFASFAQAAPALQDRTLTLNGVSKSFAMTGWRLGYAGGPQWLIQAIENLQSHSTSNPCSISQAAALAALSTPRDFLPEWLAALRRRRDIALSVLQRAAPLLQPQFAPASFYLYIECSQAVQRIKPDGRTMESDVAFAEYLLEEAGVAVVPGTAFGLSPYFRLAYVASDADVYEACEAIAAACLKLR